MKKIICIEGPDNIGKTTLCKELRTMCDATIFHLGAPKGTGNKVLHEQLATLHDVMSRITETEGNEIWDRSVIGESVYGSLYREYDHERYWSALQNLKKYHEQILFIVMYADAKTYAQWNVHAKADERQSYQRQSHARKISIRLVDVATKLDFSNTIYVNCNNYPTMDERNAYVMKRVRRWLAQKAFEYTRTHSYAQSFFNLTQRYWVEGKGFSENTYHCRMFNAHTCSIGEEHRELTIVGGASAYPISPIGAMQNVKYVFIGEASGYQPDREQLLIPLYNGASGCVFQQALDACSIHPTQYYLTNTVKCNPRGNKLAVHTKDKGIGQFECTRRLFNEITMVMEVNEYAKIIAIGKIASQYLVHMRLAHAMIYHPAYYSRIGESWRFAQELQKVM